MGLDAELYTCHKDDLNVENLFLYNGFIVTNSAVLNDETMFQSAFKKYRKSLLIDLEVISENLSRNTFWLFAREYQYLIDKTGFINACFTIVTFKEMKFILEGALKNAKPDKWLDDLRDTIYINDSDTLYIFRADW